MTLHKPGIKWAAAYLIVFIVFALVGMVLTTRLSETSLLVGLIGIVYTLPFSLVTSPILDSLGYIAWYDQFVNNPLVYSGLALLGLLPAAIMNTLLIYFAGRRTKRDKP